MKKLIAALLACGGAMLWAGGCMRRWALKGVLALVGFVALIVLWAAVDFRSFWMVLHKVFIRGGIFPYGEPIMQLFPLELFFQYIAPVCGMAAVLLSVLCGALLFKSND